MSDRLFINVIGEAASGKSVICRRLAELGCGHFVPSRAIELYAQSHGVTLSSRSDYATAYRELTREDTFGMIKPGITMAKRDVAFEGLRVVSEINKLSNFGDLVIIAADCNSDGVRFRRAMRNAEARRTKDSPDFQTFIASSLVERYSPNPEEISISTVMDMADYRIDTLDLTEREVREATDRIYSLL